MPLEQVICMTCQKEYEDSDSAVLLECEECKAAAQPVQLPGLGRGTLPAGYWDHVNQTIEQANADQFQRMYQHYVDVRTQRYTPAVTTNVTTGITYTVNWPQAWAAGDTATMTYTVTREDE